MLHRFVERYQELENQLVGASSASLFADTVAYFNSQGHNLKTLAERKQVITVVLSLFDWLFNMTFC